MNKPLVIGIDIRDLRIAKTGARTLLEETCNECKKGRPGFRFVFIDTWVPVYTGRNKLLKIIEHLRFFGWKQFTLPLICLFRGCDILYCTDYFLPVLKPGFKTAVVFHDAFFWQYPNQYNRIWLALLNSIGLLAARKADAIITPTEYSRQQVHRYTHLPLHKIHAIHLAPKTSAAKTIDVSADNHTSRKYILHVGVFEKRKNLPNLINAFNLLLKEGFDQYDLVLVGSSISKKDIDDSDTIHSLIETLGLKERVILPGFVSDAQLAHYYRHASLYVFVSVNEGFGLPLLEAFSQHLPAIVSNNNCLPEVGGDAVITCDPYDISDIKEKIKLVLPDTELQQELIRKGESRLAQFSWQLTVDKLLDVFRKL